MIVNFESLDSFLDNKKDVGLCGVCFFDFLIKVICSHNLGCLFFYFFMTYYKLFTQYKS